MIPIEFKPFLWSYDFNKLDKNSNKNLIISAILDYGVYSTWSILFKLYNKQEILEVLDHNSSTWNSKSSNFWNLILRSDSPTFIDRLISENK